MIPALNKLTVDENPPDGPYHFSQLQLVVWSLTLAFFGVFVAIPLRTQVWTPTTATLIEASDPFLLQCVEILALQKALPGRSVEPSCSAVAMQLVVAH